jgi:hypothetical protein
MVLGSWKLLTKLVFLYASVWFGVGLVAGRVFSLLRGVFSCCCLGVCNTLSLGACLVLFGLLALLFCGSITLFCTFPPCSKFLAPSCTSYT